MPKYEPIHPGEILQEEFLVPLGMSASAFARAIGVPPNRVTRLIAGKSAVTANTALRLSRALSTTPEFWLNLQNRYELQVEQDIVDDLDEIDPVIAA